MDNSSTTLVNVTTVSNGSTVPNGSTCAARPLPTAPPAAAPLFACSGGADWKGVRPPSALVRLVNVTAASGYGALLDDIRLMVPGTYQLHLRARPGATVLQWTSEAFNVTSRTIARAELLCEPDSGTPAGDPLRRQPVVGLFDQFGNLVADSNYLTDHVCTAVTATVVTWSESSRPAPGGSLVAQDATRRDKLMYVYGQAVGDSTAYPQRDVPCYFNLALNPVRCLITAQVRAAYVLCACACQCVSVCVCAA